MGSIRQRSVQNLILESGIKAWLEPITQSTLGNIGKQFSKILLRTHSIPFQMQVTSFYFSCLSFLTLIFFHCLSTSSNKCRLLILICIILSNFSISLPKVCCFTFMSCFLNLVLDVLLESSYPAVFQIKSQQSFLQPHSKSEKLTLLNSMTELSL